MKIRVEFRTHDGVVLRGDYFPVETEDAPMVIMSPDLALLKEMFIDNTARHFQEGGIAALVYDHRGWGSSDGVPYQEANLLQQAEDYIDAVSFARRALPPAIVSERIAIWGAGHSGGAAIIAMANDPRIKCAIFNVPLISGQLTAQTLPVELLDAALHDREDHVVVPNHHRSYIALWDDSPEQAASGAPSNGQPSWFHGTDTHNFISQGAERAAEAGTHWENRLTLQSLYHIGRVEPESYLQKITMPRSFLYLAAATDGFTGPVENHRRAWVESGNPLAQFIQVRQTHMDGYVRAWEESVEAQLRYLRDAL